MCPLSVFVKPRNGTRNWSEEPQERKISVFIGYRNYCNLRYNKYLPMNCHRLYVTYCTTRPIFYIFYDFFITTNKMQLFFIHLFPKGSTCFGRFLRPSSGARNCTLSFRNCQPSYLIHDTSLQQYWLTIPEAECTVICS